MKRDDLQVILLWICIALFLAVFWFVCVQGAILVTR